MRGTQVMDLEAHLAQAELGVLVQPAVGRDERHALVDPWKEVLRALRAPALGLAPFEVGARGLMRPDIGARGLERLQAVEVVGVIVREDHAAHGLARDARDGAAKRRSQRRRAERVDHHHPRPRHHESRVRIEAFIGRRGDAGLALHVIHALGDLDRRDARCDGRVFARPAERGDAEDQERREDSHGARRCPRCPRRPRASAH